MGARIAVLVVCCLAWSCTSTPPQFRPDAGVDASARDVVTDTPGTQCPAGRWSCTADRRTARRCDGDGGFVDPIDCAANSRVCADGVGCAACIAGTVRCSGAPDYAPQHCALDNSGWVNDEACDTAGGYRCQAGRCVRPCADLGASYLGCDYWPTVTANGSLPPEFTYAVALSNTQEYPITVTIEAGVLGAPMTRTVMPSTLELVRLPWVTSLSGNATHCCTGLLDTRPNCAARSVRAPHGAYHLRSDGPIAVYQFNPLEYHAGTRFSFSNDASLLLPQNVLGREYLVASWPNIGQPFATMADRCLATAARGGFVTVVNTQLEGTNTVLVHTTAPVYDPADATRVLPPGDHMFTLDPGETMQLLSQGTDLIRTIDLTGTYVRGNGPLAVFSGHECANVPNYRIACDHIEEQLFPIETWGRRYAVSPLHYRDHDEPAVVRVMAQRDGVMLTFDGIPRPAGCGGALLRGQFCEVQTAQPFQVSGTSAIQVIQYMRGLGEDPACMCGGEVCVDSPECEGDPAMVLETPIDQYRTSYRFLVPDTYSDNFINVVAPDGADLDLDGAPLVGAVAVPIGQGLALRNLHIAPGSHSLRAADGRARFGLKVYGVAPYTSYAYPGGLDLAPISPP